MLLQCFIQLPRSSLGFPFPLLCTFFLRDVTQCRADATGIAKNELFSFSFCLLVFLILRVIVLFIVFLRENYQTPMN